MMDAEFWHSRWASNNIGFHEGAPNPLLTQYFSRLQLAPNCRVFLPLCGKTRDIAWLREQGHRVVGAELSRTAIEQLFKELGLSPAIEKVDGFERFSAAGIDIWVGDIFALRAAMLGSVDAIYDRAALVALPLAMRHQYTEHLQAITGRAPQLLICFVYDQRLQDGPPFSIDANEVQRHYAAHYSVQCLDEVEVPGGLKGRCAATEQVWLLKNS
jgi:thiopurine S-methyltransferase